MDRFDTIEIRAGRTLAEADWYWKHHLTRIPAARMEIAPGGFLPKVRRILDAVLMKGGGLR